MLARRTLVAAFGLILCVSTSGMAAEPVTGVDAVVTKLPDGPGVVVGAVGPDGRFSRSIPVTAGRYKVSTACHARTRRAPFRITSVSINGRRLVADAKGDFVFSVDAGQRKASMGLVGFHIAH